jgi:hypothetical protein
MSGFSSFSSSAAASLMGKTVDEPSTATEPLAPPSPESVSAPASAPPQAESASARAAMPGTIARRKEVLFTSVAPDVVGDLLSTAKVGSRGDRISGPR